MDAFQRKPTPGDMEHLSVLVLMYTINSSDVNLEKDYKQVICRTPVSSTPLEIQAWFRGVRVRIPIHGVPEEDPLIESGLTCKRCHDRMPWVENSHDQYRNSAQATKTLLVTTCKSHDPDTLSTMAKVLNTFGQKEIAFIQEHTVLGRQRKQQWDDLQGGQDPDVVRSAERFASSALLPGAECADYESDAEETESNANSESQNTGEEEESVGQDNSSNDNDSSSDSSSDSEDGADTNIVGNPQVVNSTTSANSNAAPRVLSIGNQPEEVDFQAASLLVNPFKNSDRFKNIGENDQTDIYYSHIATLDKDKEVTKRLRDDSR